MKRRSTGNGMDRREFLAATGGGLLAGAVPAASWVHTPGRSESSDTSNSGAFPSGAAGSKRKIPIGVFDPVYDHLSLDEMLEKVSALGLEAAEIGTGGYPNNRHCPLDDLIADAAKLRAWRKKFEDHNIHIGALSCHGNPVHPDQNAAALADQTFRKTVQLAQKLDVKVIVG